MLTLEQTRIQDWEKEIKRQEKRKDKRTFPDTYKTAKLLDRQFNLAVELDDFREEKLMGKLCQHKDLLESSHDNPPITHQEDKQRHYVTRTGEGGNFATGDTSRARHKTREYTRLVSREKKRCSGVNIVDKEPWETGKNPILPRQESLQGESFLVEPSCLPTHETPSLTTECMHKSTD